MKNPSKSLILDELSTLAKMTKGEADGDVLNLYWEELQHFPLPQVIQTLRGMRRTAKWFPTVAEILEEMGIKKTSLSDQAALAWEALRCLRKGYREEALTDPITKKCFRALGGRMNFGVWDYAGQEQWKKKEFMDLYQAVAGTGADKLEISHEEAEGCLQSLLPPQ